MTPPDDRAERARHTPVRTCIGCRERAARSELLRLVVGTTEDGQRIVVPDPAGTAPGRGAHLHPTTECFELAERRRAFARALRHDAGCWGPLGLESLGQHISNSVTDLSR